MELKHIPVKCQTCSNIRSWHSKEDGSITYGCDKRTIPLYTKEEIEKCRYYHKKEEN